MSKQQEFFAAIESGHLDDVREALSADQSLVNARNESGISAVLFSLYNGKNEIAKLLIDRGARLDLFRSSGLGNSRACRAILHKDPGTINSYSPDGWTALHLAVFFGRVNIVHFLLIKGANIDALSKNDELVAPLHSALANPINSAVGQLLIGAGADSTQDRLSDTHLFTMLLRTAWTRWCAACLPMVSNRISRTMKEKRRTILRLNAEKRSQPAF